MTAGILKQYSNNATFVKEIITSLASDDIAGLFYTRIYSDGTIINLASDANWTEFYFNQLCNGLYQNKDILDQLFVYSGVSLWELNSGNKIWQDAKQYFGYGNGVIICDHHNDYREVFSIYSTIDNHQLNHFYINQIDVVKKIKQSFLYHAFDLIQQSEQARLSLKHAIFPSKNLTKQTCNFVDEVTLVQHSFESQNMMNYMAENDTKKILLSSKRIYVRHKETGLSLHLSPQRSQCMRYLLDGKSTKEIAHAMRLAPKTVDHYLEMLRKELGCRSSKELITSYAHQVV